MSAPPPVMLVYHGEGRFGPASEHWARLADAHYGEGEVVRMIRHEMISVASRGHYFASLADAHANLPDELAVQFPSVEALRKYALIKAGYCDQHTFACASKAEAQRLAAFLKPVDEYAIVVAKEATVTRYTAKSQSEKAMGKKDFQESKDAVLTIVAEMIGTSRKALESNQGASAEARR